MLDLVTALFSGTMIVLLPMLLFRTAQDLQGDKMIWSWAALALMAWGASVWMALGAFGWALAGISIGVVCLFIFRRRPNYKVVD